ncbi:LysR family transcriptional regulator [Paracoccus sp. 1_MG-2023]|uniref:LysR family transcriptional regulator n=1 Tax=unclassified Paracoccus (in: a-proteobacteria) TaxID=2688777 RepID=UPI001C0A2891|nr:MULTISPECIES: LysR family transcriptional regulator [unclassified Paracoccus (in: a-proteobacteria)]MBU2958117.1 LysR family transcriptional regulator [Paracoccus sp. C2R09]MDO6669297.1 LysR family transcriptional regulator [Paracoccus sp. 1_MG-2023]
MLNATWLETFRILCRTGSATRAARMLNMTQPGVSQHLRKLEGQAGTELVLRQGKGFVLTEAGDRLRRLAEDRHRQERDLIEGLRGDDPDRGTLAIACSGSFALMLGPRLIAHAATRPGLGITLEAAPQPTITEGVLSGRFDLGILHADPQNPRLTATAIGQEELCLVMPKGAPPPTGIDDLQDRGFVGHPDGPALADLLLGPNFDDHPGGDRLRIRVHLNQIGQIPLPIAAGIGWTVLPRSGIEASPARDRLAICPLPVHVRQPLWLITLAARPTTSRLEAAAGLIGETAALLDQTVSKYSSTVSSSDSSAM